MQKPAEWDNTEAFTGDFKNLPPGGYICRIKNAKVDTTQSGKEVLVIAFDIAEGEFANYYGEQYVKKTENNPDAKWQGIYRQLTEGNSLKFFKGLIHAIENSNNGYKWNWAEKTLKDKLFGGVFGQEEYINNNGELKLSTKCRFIRSIEQIRKGVDAPEIKKLSGTNGGSSSNINDVFPDDDIPWG
jgi:hypothetical protein